MRPDFATQPELVGQLAASGLVLKAQPHGLMAWTVAFLEQCRYRAMSSAEDFEMLARWRWEHYMEGDTIKNRSMTVGDFDDGKDHAPTARTVGLYVGDQLVSSMRMHAITQEHYNIGVVDVEKRRVADEVEKGRRFVYASRWVSDPKFKSMMPLIVATTRISCLAAEYHRADYLLSSSRENHVKTYVRMQDAVLWSETPQPLENLNYLYHLISSEYRPFRDRIAENRQAYLSSARERAQMFAPDADSALLIRPSVGGVLVGAEATGYSD